MLLIWTIKVIVLPLCFKYYQKIAKCRVCVTCDAPDYHWFQQNSSLKSARKSNFICITYFCLYYLSKILCVTNKGQTVYICSLHASLSVLTLSSQILTCSGQQCVHWRCCEATVSRQRSVSCKVIRCGGQLVCEMSRLWLNAESFEQRNRENQEVSVSRDTSLSR